jgi:hypothetical protein
MYSMIIYRRWIPGYRWRANQATLLRYCHHNVYPATFTFPGTAVAVGTAGVFG